MKKMESLVKQSGDSGLFLNRNDTLLYKSEISGNGENGVLLQGDKNYAKV